MATDVKNFAAGDSGSVKNGSITVKASKKNFQYQASAEGNRLHLISKFDNSANITDVPSDGAKLMDRFDDPRYYSGDAIG